MKKSLLTSLGLLCCIAVFAQLQPPTQNKVLRILAVKHNNENIARENWPYNEISMSAVDFKFGSEVFSIDSVFEQGEYIDFSTRGDIRSHIYYKEGEAGPIIHYSGYIFTCIYDDASENSSANADMIDIKEEDMIAIRNADDEDTVIPFQLVEEKPSFQGGDANRFSLWVNTRMVYPEIAKDNGVQGRVTLRFTVEKDGSVTKVQVLRGVDPSLDREAVRVVSWSPKWKPGKQRGRTVPVTYIFPVIFQL